jgi:type I restriction enzyme S subunit
VVEEIINNSLIGWEKTTLGEITNISTGKLDANAASSNGQYPFFTCADYISQIKAYAFDTEAVLLAGNGNFNVKWYKGKFNAYQRTYVIEPKVISGKFLFHLIRANLPTITGLNRGSTIRYIRLSDIKDCSVLLPPLNEQKRIANRIETLQAKSKKAKKALETAEPLLDKLRQSILASAFRGDLTADWRKKNPDVESASVLLERIRVERRKKWEENELVKMRAKGKEPKNDKWKSKYKEPDMIGIKGLPKLPSEWCWARLEEISILKGGLTKGKKRKETDVLKSVPYLRVANVQRGYLDLSELSLIDATMIEILEIRLQYGDILFNEGGDLDKLGRRWVWKNEVEECIHQNHVFRSRIVSNDLIPELISHFGNTFGQKWFMREGKQTTNLASLNLTKLSNFPVPIIPYEEGKEIIKKMNVLFGRLKSLQKITGNSLKKVSLLDQAILNNAFEGKLVSQNPSYEPASILLEEIKRI